MEKMNGEKLYNITLKNGGYTANPKNRYSVAVKNVIALHKDKKEDIVGIIDSMLLENYSFGLWLNDKNNNIYIDIIKTYTSEQKALAVGRKNMELSIYDLEQEKVIWIDYSK